MNVQREFSIIVPVHNGGEMVKACISSIFALRYQNYEVLVLENGSNDGTREWFDSLNDQRVRMIPSERFLTMEENWSRISTLQPREYITIIGHDDLIDPEYLDVMNELINAHPTATLYQTHFRFIDSQGRFLRHCFPMNQSLFVHEFVAHQMTRTLDSMGTGYVMRWCEFDEVGGLSDYHNLIFGDWELWVKLISLKYLAVAQSECFSYREHSSASANTLSAPYIQCLFRYVRFLVEQSRSHKALRVTINRYGPEFLSYMCSGLICRKMHYRAGGKNPDTAKQIIDKFAAICGESMPDGEPMPINLRLKWLVFLDNWAVLRVLFRGSHRFKSLLVKQCT